MEHSGENFEYLDPDTNERYIPYCVEPSVGLDRLLLVTLVDSYDEEELEKIPDCYAACPLSLSSSGITPRG